MGRTPSMTLIALLTLTCLLGACRQENTEYNEGSGLDGHRDTSTRLYLGTSQDDRCNADSGDNEDWKYILIRKPGILSISVGVDKPDQLDADLMLHDGFGRPIDRIRVTGEDDFYRFRELPVNMGRYYFRVLCHEGSSVYTVAAQFDEDRPENIDPVRVYRFIPEKKPQPIQPQRRAKKRRLTKRVAGNPPASTSNEEIPDLNLFGLAKERLSHLHQAPPPEEPKKLIGRIILTTTSQQGEVTVTIKNIGTLKKVDKDMIGSLKLEDRTVSVKLFKCDPRRCMGKVRASREEIGNRRDVTFIMNP